MPIHRPRQQAIAETKEIWKYLSEHGGHKHVAIQKLFFNDKISKPNYYCDCPLCERFLKNNKKCNSCPWPGDKSIQVRCEYKGTPYTDWCCVKSPENAACVYELVKTFK